MYAQANLNDYRVYYVYLNVFGSLSMVENRIKIHRSKSIEYFDVNLTSTNKIDVINESIVNICDEYNKYK
jgi:hypothetical protein